LKLVLLAALVALAGCGSKKEVMKSDWEARNERFLSDAAPEVMPPPPPYPREQNLVRFDVSAGNDFRYFVDSASLSVSDGRVFYTLISRSPSGVDNISYEALNCREGEFRSYARGTSDGKWITRPTAWRRVEHRPVTAQYTLHWEYLCPRNTAIANAAEGVSALRSGGHPFAKVR
jgi:hypothetical protein